MTVGEGQTVSNINAQLGASPPNNAPVAVADAFAGQEDQLLAVAAPGVLGNDSDVDGDAVSAVLVSSVGHGTLALAGDGSFTYEPAADFHGVDSFTYKANDGTVDSAAVTVTLTVAAVNDAPVAVADAFAGQEDQPVTVAAPGVLANDSDVDGDALSAVLVSSVGHGTLTLAADGSFTYNPAADFHGVDSFTYKANDGTADSAAVTVTLTIAPSPVPPVPPPPESGSHGYVPVTPERLLDTRTGDRRPRRDRGRRQGGRTDRHRRRHHQRARRRRRRRLERHRHRTPSPPATSPSGPAATPTHRLQPQHLRRRHHRQPRHRQDRHRRQGLPLHPQPATHLIADINGYFPAGTDYTAGDPRAHVRHPHRHRRPRRHRRPPTAGRTDRHRRGTSRRARRRVAAVVVNVTATEPHAAGYVTVWPCGQPRPTASNLNTAPGLTIPNLVIAKIGTGGKVCLYTLSRPPTSSPTSTATSPPAPTTPR